MPATEYEEWREFYKLYPFDDDAYTQNRRWGQLLALTANVNRSKGSRTYRGSDFLMTEPPISFSEMTEQEIEEHQLQQLRKWQAFAAFAGGTVETSPEWQKRSERQG